jgi:hypothetical protein
MEKITKIHNQLKKIYKQNKIHHIGHVIHFTFPQNRKFNQSMSSSFAL